MGFDWGSVISAAIPSVVGLAGGLFQGAQEDERAQEALDAQKEDSLRQLQLMALKEKYGLGGGGGGGGGGNSQATLMQAYQAHLNNLMNASDRKVQALNQLGAVTQAANLRSGR